MTIYILELVLIWLFGTLLYSRKISGKMFIVLSFTIMTLILGLRAPSVGEDTQHYIDIFNYSRDISWTKVLTSGTDTVYLTAWGVDLSVETGFMLLNKFVGIFTDNGQWLIFIVAALTCWLFGKFILDNCEKVFFPSYIFMCESLYMFAFNGMRQMLSLAIAIQAYKLVKEKRIKATILVFMLAFLIHRMSIALLILIPLGLVKKKQKALKWVFICDAVLMVSIPVLRMVVSRIVPRYASYFTTNYWEPTLGLGSSLLLLVEAAMCLYIYFKRINKSDTETFMAVAGTSLSIAFEIMGLQVVMFGRTASMFKVFLMFLFPTAGGFFTKNTRLIYFAFMIFVLTYAFIRYASTPVRLYSFFWQ